MSEAGSFHMSPEEFRRQGHALVDWIARYQEEVEKYPVLSTVKPGEILAKLPAAPPQQGESFEAMLADVDRLIMPGITHWQSPNFFAYFPANNSGPSILGELLSAGLGVQGMLWSTSPACTELETRVLDWVAEMLGLPARFRSTSAGGGVIQDSASGAVLCALLAARERATACDSNLHGTDPRLTVYCSPQAHSSIEKAVRIAGIGTARLRKIETDHEHRLRPDLLEAEMQRDVAAGLRPCFAVATIGTTSSTAFDPLGEIAAVCRKHDVWFHVDGAMAGSAAVCPEFRHLQRGLELADSYAFNPHKWLFTNFDCDCFYVADRAALIRALSILPEYLRNKATESGAVIDYRDWQVPLGRRFRALKLWFVIRHYGVEGLRFHIRRHVALAQYFAQRIATSTEFRLCAQVPLNLVCFAHRRGDDFTRQLLEALNATGRLFLTHTTLNGHYVMRFCVGQTHTEERHVEAAFELIQQTATQLLENQTTTAPA
jgi:aromatic-L-amino-acid decarboxylase